MYIADSLVERLIREDVPYIDLTTMVLGIGTLPGRIEFFSREDAVVAGVEEVLQLFGKLNVRASGFRPSGSGVKPGEVFLAGEGEAADLHAAWKVSLNVLEHCSGVATRTRRMVDAARRVNPAVNVATTRKIFPGTKELATRAVVAGGGYPHRLGLSETILVFGQHLAFLGGLEGFLNVLPALREKICEKKVIVEAEGRDEAVRLCRAGVDGIQFDKVPPGLLTEIVAQLRDISPRVTLLAAGGINQGNVAQYAATGVDVLVTTAVYFGKPADMSARMTRAPVG